MKTNFYKHILLGALCITMATGVMAQQAEPCGTDLKRTEMFKAHPELIKEAEEYEKQIQNQIALDKASRAGDSTSLYVVPVVFHVLHVNGSENISDAQILDEMTNLNKYFRKLGTAPIVPGFDSIAADVVIEFRLAQRDPQGNCTNGIDRIYSHKTLNGDDDAKINQWPPDHYLNIWVVKDINPDRGSGVLAYATFPSNSIYQIPYDGILIKSNTIGTGANGGTGSLQYSTTLAHEIGHYLNLSHVWGNTAVGTACGDDGVEDTPPTKGRQSKCTVAELYTPVCTVNNVSNPYTFSKVTPVSGVIDTTAAPVAVTTGGIFGRFKATGVSANSVDSNAFAFSNWDLGGLAVNGDTTYSNLTGSINTGKYYEVTITPKIRYSGTLTGITFAFQRSASGVRSYAVRSSVDGYASNLAASVVNDTLIRVRGGNTFFARYDTTDILLGSKITLSGAAYTNFITPITFRFYGWNAEDAAGTFSIDNVSFAGTVGLMENVQNYMDYSWCLPMQSMFTRGQRDRMRAALTNSVGKRSSLYINSNLIATGVAAPAECAPVPDFYSNRNYICAGTGTQITFYRNIKKGTPTSYIWSFPGGNPSTSTASNPVVTYTNPGFYDVTLTATNAVGTDSVVKKSFIKVGQVTGDLNGTGYSENFESINKFWGWQVNDWDSNVPNSWVYANSGYNSSHSVKMGGYNNYFGDIDDLISPSLDMTGMSSVVLTFRCAGASQAYVSADMNDVLRISSSNNCGQVWSLRSTIDKTTLNNNGYHPESFVPNSASQWALHTVTIPGGVVTSNVRFKFEYTSGDASNNIYIDDINISGVVGIKENTLGSSNLSVYPNPTNQTSTIAYHLDQKSSVKITLVDVLGKTVSEINNNIQPAGDYSFLISKQDLDMRNGIYFIKFSVNDNTVTQKLVVTE